MKINQYTFLLYCVLLTFNSCKNTLIPQEKLITGDLIFVESNEQNLSGAISRVTKNKKSKISFDHIGIIEKSLDSVFVLHATTVGGSKKEDLESFIKSQKVKKLVVYRLKNKYKSSIPTAIKRAKEMLGKPYNFLYIPNDSSFYCSDFIQRAFEKDSIFDLEPMTFINPVTGVTDTYWQNFYDQHNVKVPEGLPGCNPNGLSESKKIQRILIFN